VKKRPLDNDEQEAVRLWMSAHPGHNQDACARALGLRPGRVSTYCRNIATAQDAVDRYAAQQTSAPPTPHGLALLADLERQLAIVTSQRDTAYAFMRRLRETLDTFDGKED
jgi:hypothetical protein